MFARRSSIHGAAAIALLVLLALSLLPTHPAFAGFVACRADPIVWLSNGQSIQITATINAAESDVSTIVYTVHVPVGTTITRVVYNGGGLGRKERVILVDDQAPNQYWTDTVVDTKPTPVGVLAISSMGGSNFGADSGYNSEHLIVSFHL